MRRSLKVLVLLLFVLSLFGCATTNDPATMKDVNAEKGTKEAKPEPLRIGITPNYPPLIFKEGRNISGVEADLALHLGDRLNRPVHFIELSWDKQIPALLEGKIDMIMSGMSITTARKVRINFTNHYVKSGLVAAFRAEDANKFDSPDNILKSYATVGVVEGTTGDAFVNRNFPNAIKITLLSDSRAGGYELKRRRIDIFVHDAPAVMWVVSENEADLTALWKPFNEEHLAWGVRKDNKELLFQANNALNAWKTDGTLERVLLRWLPRKYLEFFK